ncbi:MAG: Gfo/Idh/MocA family oxidoreductase [Thermotogota bacterium]|nr:Gfo/Idh/MocA family oxidoreductase [Thermotogota bacterium]
MKQFNKKGVARFGIIGCGAITEMAYLPVFKEFSIGQLTCLVDADIHRASALAKDFDLSYVGKNLEAIFDYVDVVIVAVPNHLHFPICKVCLKAGKHVLCEKPMAMNAQECEELISLANKYSLKLAVAHVRRFYPAAKKIKEIVVSRELGDVKSFDFAEGTVFGWPTVSGFFFDKEKAGGGVLMDIGVHLLDLLLWWLPCETVHVNYEDDNLGGVEAFAKIEIRFSNGVTGKVKLSRLSVLKNFYILYFEKGNIKWDPFSPKRIYIQKFQKSLKTIKVKKGNPVKDMLSNFVYSIQNDQRPLVIGEDALSAIQLIERCYHSRKLLPLEWLHVGKGAPCG